MNNLILNICLLFSFIDYACMAQGFRGNSELIYSLNSPYHESYIAIHPEGKLLAFSRANHPYNQGETQDIGDVWIARFDSIWHPPTNWHEVNSDEFSSPIGWSGNGSAFLFNKVSKRGGMLKTEIWIFSNGQSSKLEIEYFKNKSEFQSGCISADNQYMIVSMESGDTEGVEDLYLIKKNGAKWKAPMNLGSIVNTQYQEITPFLAADNTTLYFASNGRKGEGGFDIYVTKRLDDTWRNWSVPENLGFLVNSSGRESSFVFAPGSDIAYFVSTRNSDGYGDIRKIRFKEKQEISKNSFESLELVVKVDGAERKGIQLINAKSSEPIKAFVSIRSPSGSQNLESDSEGWIENLGRVEGQLAVKGFLPVDIFVASDTSIVLRLEPLEVGRTIRLDHVLFVRGQARIMESSFSEIDKVVDMMRSNPEIKILLKGHTDGHGDPNQNLKLSEERAQATQKYLVEKGVSRKRISSKGFGGQKPIASNETEETRRLNRRVEIEIVD